MIINLENMFRAMSEVLTIHGWGAGHRLHRVAVYYYSRPIYTLLRCKFCSKYCQFQDRRNLRYVDLENWTWSGEFVWWNIRTYCGLVRYTLGSRTFLLYSGQCTLQWSELFFFHPFFLVILRDFDDCVAVVLRAVPLE